VEINVDFAKNALASCFTTLRMMALLGTIFCRRRSWSEGGQWRLSSSVEMYQIRDMFQVIVKI
jgi:hypothetical protein